MRFERVAQIKTANQVVRELQMVPKKALEIVNDFGTKIYCFDKDFKPSWIGLVDKCDTSEDKRSLNDTSLYYLKYKATFIHEIDLKEAENEKAYSTILHEFGHALDHALGNKNGEDCYLSYVEPKIYEGWQQDKGLDWYANLDPAEYFAQAFMAYCYTGLENYKPWSYREHTREELKLKDSDMFYFLKSLLA